MAQLLSLNIWVGFGAMEFSDGLPTQKALFRLAVSGKVTS